MQSTALQACKVQATLSGGLSASVAPAAARASVQALRPQAPSFVKAQIVQSVRGSAVSAVTEAPSPASPPSERQSPPPSPRRSINNLGFQLKFIVPNSITGAVMGKGGENVSRIHDATGAFIQASRAGSAVLNPRDRMITVAGDNAHSVKEAVRLLLLTLKDLNVSDRLERSGYPIGRLFLKQVIPAPCAGKVLGPGGDQIQSINMSTGASVVIEAKTSNAAFIPFRYVNYMASNVEKLIDAVNMVTNLLNEDERYVPGIREITSVAFKVVQIPEKRAGSLLGPGGTHIQTLQDVIRVKLGICEGNKPGSRYVAVWGPPTNVNVALDVIAVATGGTPRGAMEMMKEDFKISDYHHDDIDDEVESSGSESVAEVQEREAELRRAEAARIGAESEARAARDRLRLIGMSDEAIERLASSERVEPSFAVRASISGRVIERHVAVGEFVGPERDALFVLADMQRLWVLADVPGGRLNELAEGARARVLFGTEEGHWCNGVVSFLSPALDPATRSVRVRIEPEESHPDLRPGVFAQAEIESALAHHEPVVAVPEGATQTVEGETVVFVPVEGLVRTFRPRVVRSGPPVLGRVPVLEGLAEGELYVAEGSFLLKAELLKSSVEEEE